MQRIIFLFMTLIFCTASYAQDERYFRSIFSGELFDQEKETFYYKINVASKKYMLDLDRDGKDDSFQTVKKDGNDFIRINDEYGREVFSAMLDTKGRNSSIFKASFKKIGNDVDVLILHFYEGETQAGTYEASGRLYFLTIQKNNLKKITMTKGPYFWHERERAAGKYWNRRYTVNTIDYNKDGYREISVTYHKGNRVYFFTPDGEWKMI